MRRARREADLVLRRVRIGEREPSAIRHLAAESADSSNLNLTQPQPLNFASGVDRLLSRITGWVTRKTITGRDVQN